MAFWCILIMRVLMLDFEIFRLVILIMEYLCIAPPTPVVMAMRGFPSIILYGVN